MRAVALTVAAGLIAVAASSVGGRATLITERQTFDGGSADEAAILALVLDVDRHFNEGDAVAMAQLYSPDSDRRDATGRHAKGRAEVREMYEAGFRTRQTRRLDPSKQTRFDGDVRFLRADVALVDGFYTLSDSRKGPYTLVVVKNDGRWLIAAGRAGALIQ